MLSIKKPTGKAYKFTLILVSGVIFLFFSASAIAMECTITMGGSSELKNIPITVKLTETSGGWVTGDKERHRNYTILSESASEDTMRIVRAKSQIKQEWFETTIDDDVPVPPNPIPPPGFDPWTWYSPFSSFDAEGVEGTMKAQFGYLGIDPVTGLPTTTFYTDEHPEWEWDMEPGNPYAGFTAEMIAHAQAWEPQLREKFADAFPGMSPEERATMAKFAAAGYEYLESHSSPPVPLDKPSSNSGTGFGFETADGTQYFMEFGEDAAGNRTMTVNEITSANMPIDPSMFSFMDIDANRWARAMAAGIPFADDPVMMLWNLPSNEGSNLPNGFSRRTSAFGDYYVFDGGGASGSGSLPSGMERRSSAFGDYYVFTGGTSSYSDFQGGGWRSNIGAGGGMGRARSRSSGGHRSSSGGGGGGGSAPPGMKSHSGQFGNWYSF